MEEAVQVLLFESHLGQDQIVQTSTLQGSLSNAVLRLTFQSVCFSAKALILCHQGHTLSAIDLALDTY